jgi:hypothetical protein
MRCGANMMRHLTALCATPSSLCSKRQARAVVSHLIGENARSTLALCYGCSGGLTEEGCGGVASESTPSAWRSFLCNATSSVTKISSNTLMRWCKSRICWVSNTWMRCSSSCIRLWVIPSFVRNHLEMILTIPQTITAVTRKSKTAMMTSFSFCPQQLLHCSLPTAEGILAPQHSYYTPAFLDSTCVRSRVPLT